jgi:Tetratricopeptide repeat/PEGA domain
MKKNLRSRCWVLRSALLSAWWCGLGTGIPSAYAQAAARDTDIDAIVQHGIELRRAARDVEALAEFTRALALEPGSTRVRIHLAATYQALGQWPQADDYLDGVLKETDDAYVERHRARLLRAQFFVREHLGELGVIGQPAGAEVLVNGQRIGTLPMSRPVRLPVGSYVLEARMEGYYSASRPIALTNRSPLRESLELTPRDVATDTSTPGAPGVDRSFGSPRWLTWTLAGVGAGAAVGSVVAWSLREKHADRWNSATCLEADRRRGEVCPAELDAGRDAERVAYVTSVSAGLLLGGALTSWLLEAPTGPRNEADEATQTRCRLGLGEVSCFGSF